MNKILRRRTRTAHRGEIPGGGQLFITIAMPLDPAIGYAMVVFFFEDRLHHEYYSYVCLSLEVGGIKLNKRGEHMHTCAHAHSETPSANKITKKIRKKNRDGHPKKKNSGTSAMFQCVHATCALAQKIKGATSFSTPKGKKSDTFFASMDTA